MESIEVCCDKNYYLSEYELLKVITEYSSRKFYELRMVYNELSDLFPEDLESVLIGWANRIPRKSLSLIIIGTNSMIGTGLKVKKESMEVIEKFSELGVVKLKIINDF